MCSRARLRSSATSLKKGVAAGAFWPAGVIFAFIGRYPHRSVARQGSPHGHRHCCAVAPPRAIRTGILSLLLRDLFGGVLRSLGMVMRLGLVHLSFGLVDRLVRLRLHRGFG